MARPKGINKKQDVKNMPVNGIFKQKEWFFLAAILVITFIVFSPSIFHDFVNYDDDWMIYENKFVTEFNWENIKGLFTTFYYGQYSPFSMIIIGMVYQLGAGSVLAMKLGSLVLHLINAFLVFHIFRKLFSDLRIGLIAMAFFAIHPVQVESVAWLSASYKVGIFALFSLAGIYFWIRFLETNKITFYMGALLLMILSCFAKEQALIFPLFILLISYYKGVKLFSLKELIRFLPFALVSLAFVIVSYMAVASRAEVNVSDYALIERIYFLSYSFISYLRLLIIPVNLAPFYGFPESTSAGYFIFPILSAIALFIMYLGAKSDKKVLWAYAFYIISLLLTFALLIVSIRDTLYADRYLYLGVPAFFTGLILYLERITRKNLTLPVTLVVIVFSIMAFTRVQAFKNSETLWTDAINKKYNNPLAYNNRGHYYRQNNQIDKAISDYNEALKINPNYHLSLNNRGKIYFDRGQVDLAMTDFNKSISIAPNYVSALSNRGAAHASKNDFETALIDLNKALDLDPQNTNALSNRSLTWYSLNNFDKAAEDVSAYLRLKPDDADMLNLRSLCYNRLDRDQEALADLNRAIMLIPSQGVFWQNRSFLLNKMGDRAGALRDIQQAQALGIQVNQAYLSRLQEM
jgi:protein O-mannosyl-transferase